MIDETFLLNEIKNNNIDHIKQLLSYNYASEATIRRKLKSLETLGYIKMYYGGQIIVEDEENVSIQDIYKENINVSEKEDIALRASLLIDDQDVIYIDNGTTVRRMFKYLRDKDIKIYTNGYNHVNECEKYNIDIIFISGELLYREAAIVGEEAIAFITGIKFDKVFIGANGYTDNEVTTPLRTEALLKHCAIKNTDKAYILIDSSKKNLHFKNKVCSTDECIIITGR